MVTLYTRGNEALEINPPTGLDIHITSHGSDWYWAAFSLFALATLVYIGTSYLKPRNERLFYYSSTAAAFVMAIGYYTLASDLGWTGIEAEFNHATVANSSEVPGVRQIFYARFVAWFLAFPVYITNLGIVGGVDVYNLLFTIVAQEIFVVSLLIGALIHSTYKWGYFVFGVVGYLLVAYNLLFPFRKAAGEVGTEAHKIVTIFASLGTFILFIYPIAWGLSEGGNVIQPDSEAAFYGVLDVIFFLVLGSGFLAFSSTVPFEQLGITSATKKPVFHKYVEKNEVTRPSGETAIQPQTEAQAEAQV